MVVYDTQILYVFILDSFYDRLYITMRYICCPADARVLVKYLLSTRVAKLRAVEY
jgi:hypothetical protein